MTSTGRDGVVVFTSKECVVSRATEEGVNSGATGELVGGGVITCIEVIISGSPVKGVLA